MVEFEKKLIYVVSMRVYVRVTVRYHLRAHRALFISAAFYRDNCYTGAVTSLVPDHS